jgi:hypothetical protein
MEAEMGFEEDARTDAALPTRLMIEEMAREHEVWAHEWVVIGIAVTALGVAVFFFFGVPQIVGWVCLTVAWGATVRLRVTHLLFASRIRESARLVMNPYAQTVPAASEWYRIEPPTPAAGV